MHAWECIIEQVWSSEQDVKNRYLLFLIHLVHLVPSREQRERKKKSLTVSTRKMPMEGHSDQVLPSFVPSYLLSFSKPIIFFGNSKQYPTLQKKVKHAKWQTREVISCAGSLCLFLFVLALPFFSLSLFSCVSPYFCVYDSLHASVLYFWWLMYL